MFKLLSNRFSKIFSNLSKRRNLNENNISDALNDIKKALLASDVAFDVVQDFIAEVKNECIGQRIFANVEPGQQVVKIVYDKLVAILGGEQAELSRQRPLHLMMIGLQGSGKTTSCAKLALYLKEKGEQPALVACDIYRPAAIEQLKILGEQIGVPVLSYGGIAVKEIAKKALEEAKKANYSVLIFDTAGRLQIDTPLIEEVQQLKEIIQPQEILLALDSALGQEAIHVGRTFNEALGLTGIVLTKLDGDAKGGAVLSMKRSAHLPIKFSGIGEKVQDFEAFYPDRMATRILGMGDIVSLVEKVQSEYDQDVVDDLGMRLIKGEFCFDDFLKQMETMMKIGGMKLSKWIPSLPAFQTPDHYEEEMKRFKAIILSMTKQERRVPHLMNSSYRRARVIKGSGVTVSQFNQFLKRFQMIKKMSHKMQKAKPEKVQSMLESMTGSSRFLTKNIFK